MQKLKLRVFYTFPGVNSVVNGLAALVPAEHLVIHCLITQKNAILKI